jgi:hypothetical protein
MLRWRGRKYGRRDGIQSQSNAGKGFDWGKPRRVGIGFLLTAQTSQQGWNRLHFLGGDDT